MSKAAPRRVRPGQLLRTVEAAQPADLESLVRAPDPDRIVEVCGPAIPGASGPLRAPLSGQPCAWYRTVTAPMDERGAGRRRYRVPQAQPPERVQSSSHPVAPTGRAYRPRQQRVDESRAPFAVGSDAASVTVDPRHAVIDTDVVTTNKLTYDRDGWATALQQEWIVPLGHDLHVFGGVARGVGDQQGRLVGTPTTDVPVVATRDRQYLVTLARFERFVPGPRAIVAIVLVPALLVGALVALYVTGVL